MSLIAKEVTDYVQAEIKLLDEELFALQQSIWEHPETAYQETFAHGALTTYMEKQPGWTVTKHAYNLDTAFLCVFTNSPEKNPAVISFNSEFDALPNIGHGCGHNLIAISGVTAAIATAKAMAKFDIPGTVKLIGTPAEEGGGGKIKLIEAGAWDGVDVSLMAHPMHEDTSSYGATNANQRFKIEFFGKEAHAAASPWEGINALDAMVMMYNAVSVLRQQLLPTDIVQCHIIDGGQAPNIITGHSSAVFAVRAPTRGRLKELENKVIKCAQAGALATGCKYKISYMTNYYNMLCNDSLCKAYSRYMTLLGEKMRPFSEDKRLGFMTGSTDQGNVSWIVPSIHTLFHIDSDSGPHTRVFAATAKTRASHDAAVRTGVAMSFIGIELLQHKEKLDEAKETWECDIKEQQAYLSSASVTIDKVSELVYTE